jgi:signal recognition particle subunit SRP54
VNRLVKQFAEMQKMMKRFGMTGKGKKGKRGAGFPGLPPGEGFPDLAELSQGLTPPR